VDVHRAESRNESELGEILQDDSESMEEEVITVEYSNLTSQRISVDQFIREFPDKRSDDTLDIEFSVCIQFDFFYNNEISITVYKLTAMNSNKTINVLHHHTFHQ
jgi:hypothetical protein